MRMRVSVPVSSYSRTIRRRPLISMTVRALATGEKLQAGT
jgi:hypothetical protein